MCLNVNQSNNPLKFIDPLSVCIQLSFHLFLLLFYLSKGSYEINLIRALLAEHCTLSFKGGLGCMPAVLCTHLNKLN